MRLLAVCRGAVLSAGAASPFTFTPPLGKAVRLSSASLAHNAKSSARASLLISCPSTSPDSTSTPITVTTLTSAAHPSTLLDLYLLGGQEVALQAKGDGDIHVGGYCTVQDIGEEGDDDEGEYDEGEGEGYLIDEHQADEDEEEEEEEEEEAGRGWTVHKRAAKAQAVRSIIDELREDEAEGGEDEGEELDDSDFIGELLEGGTDDEDEEDDEDDEDDAEMYEFGEEEENEASNEELADAIRQQLAGKIRVIDTDEEDSEEDSADDKRKQPAKRAAGNSAAAAGKKVTPKPAPSATNAAAAPKTPSQPNGKAAGKKRAVEEKTPAAAATSGKKQKTAPATPETSATAGTAAASPKTIKCPSCNKLFSSEAGMQQHADTKHKAT